MKYPAFIEVFRLPQLGNFSKKYTISNFLYYYFLSLPYKKNKSVRDINGSPGTDSPVWDSFKKNLLLNAKHIAPQFITRTVSVQKSSGGYLAAYFVKNKTLVGKEDQIERLPAKCKNALHKVADVLSSRFSGISRERGYNWLCTYQLAALELDFTPEEMAQYFENNMVIELGGGIGANALVHAMQTDKNVVIYDLPETGAIQRVVLDEVKDVLPSDKISLISDIDELYSTSAGKDYVVVSYWAYTEFEVNFRQKFIELIKNSKLTIIAFSPQFEGTDNLKFVEDIVAQMPGKSLRKIPVWWKAVKGHHYVAIH